MDRRYQVFVSSTYLDLVEERREVIQALLEIDCLPAGMEMFPAADESQWSLIKKVIDQSDFYILVIGGRYGSLTGDGISYTEMEYDYAVETGKPAFGFLHGSPGSIAADKSELDKEAREKLEAFRNKVQAKHVKFYDSAVDLGGKVSRAMGIATRNSHAEGWVRGRFAMTPEVQAEVAEMRARLSELTLNATVQRDATVPDDLASGDDTYEIETTLYYRSAAELAAEEHTLEPASLRWETVRVPVSWNELVAELGPRMFEDAAESSLMVSLCKFAQRMAVRERRVKLPMHFGYAENVEVAQQSFDDIMLQLFALNTIGHGTQLHADRSKYWTLAPLGKDTLMKLRAIRSS